MSRTIEPNPELENVFRNVVINPLYTVVGWYSPLTICVSGTPAKRCFDCVGWPFNAKFTMTAL